MTELSPQPAPQIALATSRSCIPAAYYTIKLRNISRQLLVIRDRYFFFFFFDGSIS